jgi:hypothetical protein
MNLSPKYIATFVLLMFAMIGWNAFLIVRDSKLYNTYESKQQQYCQQLKVWHPDCKIE